MTGSKPVIGVDVGSTTVKTVVVDPGTRRMLWSAYQRHETEQARVVAEQLEAVERAFPEIPMQGARLFATGSGAPPICQMLGAAYIQEVNAVVTAVDTLHHDVGSVIELGGQDAKIVIFKRDPTTGQRHIDATMNDRCAAGTGATIDKCLAKTGVSVNEAAAVTWDGSRLHHVAAKCGVFAETDIVNLLKSGVPSPEILCSLADAIVTQNLSVLTRGSTLPHHVLLLGGPNLYLPFLRDCWRARIPETWAIRDYPFPADVAIADLIRAPGYAHLYAAYGAAIYGLGRGATDGRYRGTAELRASIEHGRHEYLRAGADPPLVRSVAERDAFSAHYAVPAFVPHRPRRGTTLRGYLGIDGGSTSSKAVLVDAAGDILCKAYMLSVGNPLDDVKALLGQIESHVAQCGATLEILGTGVTGYAGRVLHECLHADVTIVETMAHMKAATRFFGDVDVICDVGGQDIKVLFMANGEIRDFRLSHQCSAGNGMLLQTMAAQFGISIADYATHAFKASLSPCFSYGCAVFLDTDRVNFQKEGYTKEELLAGLARVLPKNIWQYVVQVPRLASLGRRFVLQGGAHYNLAAVKAQHDYIVEHIPDAVVHLHPHPGEAGAIGAALEAIRVVAERGHSWFIGIRNAVGLEYVARSDATTTCMVCENKCQRTFIDASTPDGHKSRFIAGFSCERGTVESSDELKRMSHRRSRLRSTVPNLVDDEARLAFRRVFVPADLPAAGTRIDPRRNARPGISNIGSLFRRRTFQRSTAAQQARRAHLRIGIPRALGAYMAAPMWRAFFETLGLRPGNIVFSDPTSERLWTQGARYGSVDPCFPGKVSQAHIHNLLFTKHPLKKLDFIFFPCVTHVPTHVVGTVDSASCPIVAGTPVVMRAAFTKEIDFFARAGIEFVSPAVTLIEPNYLKKQLFEAWGEHLGATRDEIEFACEQGFEALRLFDTEMERRGRKVLEMLEAEHRLGILLLGRPYHADPGLNHDVLDDLQGFGFPILSMRSIPKRGAWIERIFADAPGDSSRSVSDILPENFSSSSVQKLWAAKFAARHPNIAVLDISSFKCGLDAPLYTLITDIFNASGTPYCALHDLDANKPAGSLKMRIETFAYSLRRRQESLIAAAGQTATRQIRLGIGGHEVHAARHPHMRGMANAISWDDFEKPLAEHLAGEIGHDSGADPEPPSIHAKPTLDTEARNL